LSSVARDRVSWGTPCTVSSTTDSMVGRLTVMTPAGRACGPVPAGKVRLPDTKRDGKRAQCAMLVVISS
jgi:hypothetical protein